MSGKYGAVTLDVDGLRHYHAIHGLPPPADDSVALRGTRRFLELCAKLGVRATLFVVGADLEDDDEFARVIEGAARAGHEIASHSFAHAYDLSTQARASIDADIGKSVVAIERVSGRRPRGFRAPGYNVSDALFESVVAHGFSYDSSVMRSPAYFAARALAIGAHRLRGRTSASLVGRARDFLLSRPMPPGLREIPISTLPGGLPWIGTTIALSPRAAVAAQTALAMLEARRTKEPLVLELHAIDFCDVDDGIAPTLQRDVRVRAQTKIARIEVALRTLMRGCEVRPLLEVGDEPRPHQSSAGDEPRR